MKLVLFTQLPERGFCNCSNGSNCHWGERNLTKGLIPANNTHEMYKLGGRLGFFLQMGKLRWSKWCAHQVVNVDISGLPDPNWLQSSCTARSTWCCLATQAGLRACCASCQFYAQLQVAASIFVRLAWSKWKVNLTNWRLVLEYVGVFFVRRQSKRGGSKFCSLEVIKTKLILKMK